MGLAGRLLTAAVGSLVLASCNTPVPLPSGAEAYQIIPPPTGEFPEYRIGASDSLSILVFGEPDLSAPTIRVDSAGQVNLPLIGSVVAKDKTTNELARDIEARLSPRYLVRARVTVNVNETASQRVTVEGEVAAPGVFQISGPTTLLDVLAMSRGPTRTAKLAEVAIFRKINGEQMAAKFNVRNIRRGIDANPAILGNDIVVVGFDRVEGAWRDILSAAPAFSVFTRLYRL